MRIRMYSSLCVSFRFILNFVIILMTRFDTVNVHYVEISHVAVETLIQCKPPSLLEGLQSMNVDSSLLQVNHLNGF